MSARTFVSEPIHPLGGASTPASNEPALPAAFRWRDETLEVKTVRKTWRSTKDDRGDTYLKRHWFEFDTTDGRTATVYFDRAAKRRQPHWWIYAIEEV
jgi:Family of unknown function (DUF6504)